MPVPIHQVDQLTSFAVWPAMYVISLTPTSYQTSTCEKAAQNVGDRKDWTTINRRQKILLGCKVDYIPLLI